MAAFYVTRVVLNIVLIGLLNSCMAQTEPSIVCNSSDDTMACRYDCPAEVVQEHCTSEKEKDGHCCPGYYRTKISTCQECPEDHFMPHVNNCHCSCLLCAECDGRVNNTKETSCNHTTDTVCTLWNDPPSRAPSACPWIESTSNPTTQVPTTQVPTAEEVSVNTPSDLQGSKSEQTYKGGCYTFMALFFIVVSVLLLFCICSCCYLRYAYRSVPIPTGDEPNDQADGEKGWKDVAGIVAVRIQRTFCARCKSGCQCRVGGQDADAGIIMQAQRRPLMRQVVEHQKDQKGSTKDGIDETDETLKADTKQRTVCDRCQQVIEKEDSTGKNGDHPAGQSAAQLGDQTGDEGQEKEKACT